MRRPALLLLRLVSANAYASYVLADLEDEYRLKKERRGAAAARRWYWWQALRSACWLVRMDLGRSDWEASALAILGACAGGVLAMDAGWSWLLSAIPLKADILRGADFAALCLILEGMLAACAGAACSLRGLALAVPAGCVFAWLGLAASRGIVGGWFCLALSAAVSLGLLAGAALRRGMKSHSKM